MPRYNGTGPLGYGPMTGRGLGPCGAGQAFGRGRGLGRGIGRGFGLGYQTYTPNSDDTQAYILDLEAELKDAKNYLKDLQSKK